MPYGDKKKICQGQTAMEYLILLGLLTVLALTAFRNLLPNAVAQINGHFNVAATNIVGEVPQDSKWSNM